MASDSLHVEHKTVTVTVTDSSNQVTQPARAKRSGFITLVPAPYYGPSRPADGKPAGAKPSQSSKPEVSKTFRTARGTTKASN